MFSFPWERLHFAQEAIGGLLGGCGTVRRASFGSGALQWNWKGRKWVGNSEPFLWPAHPFSSWKNEEDEVQKGETNGFASAVISYLHISNSCQELGRYRTAKADLQCFSCLFMPNPAPPGNYNGHIKTGFCLLTMSSGYPHLVFTASSIAPDEIFFGW